MAEKSSGIRGPDLQSITGRRTPKKSGHCGSFLFQGRPNFPPLARRPSSATSYPSTPGCPESSPPLGSSRNEIVAAVNHVQGMSGMAMRDRVVMSGPSSIEPLQRRSQEKAALSWRRFRTHAARYRGDRRSGDQKLSKTIWLLMSLICRASALVSFLRNALLRDLPGIERREGGSLVD